MRNTGKTTGLLLILLMAGIFNLSAQRGMRGMRTDSMRMRHDTSNFRGMRQPFNGNHQFRGMPGGRGERQPLYGMQHFRGMQERHGMRGRVYVLRPVGPRDRMMGRGRGFSGDMIENIPGLSADQKDKLTKLKEEGKDDLKELREQQQEKMKDLRESHRKKVMGVLNDEQKEWIEKNAPAARF